MLRRHINDTNYAVDIKGTNLATGPCACPQPGCQSSDGSSPRSRGSVVYEEFGGNSGDYITSLPCKCCDGKGRLYDGERAYQSYCFAYSIRDLRTGYPNPFPMSRSLYDDPELVRRVQEKASQKTSEGSNNSGDCYVATSIYGSYDAEPVLVLRKFRDECLFPFAAGRLFVRAYYATSPALVRFTHNFSRTRVPVKAVLDCLVNHLRNK
jgi:hypothetical protein